MDVESAVCITVLALIPMPLCLQRGGVDPGLLLEVPENGVER